ncbi:MAG: 4Fe-4S dicluster domain-containing protein [Gammaproteobacteria bacterium]|nr:4Fe-4S dicluster domain-containing protein [Gammaproteobacteria bacterium]
MNDLSVKNQIAWVVDLNKCIGCQTCSVACKVLWTRDESEKAQWWCSVNTLPGRGTPRDWEEMGGGYDEAGKPQAGKQPAAADFGGGFKFNHDEVFYGGSAGKVHLEPQAPREGRWAMNWDEDQGAGEWPNSYYFYAPRLCNHCSHPACVEACPSKAISKQDDGLVIRDEDICMGSRFCMEACPYKKIYFNYERHVAQHCIGCFPRIEKGVAPACVRQCPGRAVFVGRLNDADGPVNRLVKQYQVALPLHGEYGTHPNVYYVPPLSPSPLKEDMSIDTENPRIPPQYLESLFGPDVHNALEILKGEMQKVRDGGESGLMKTLIAYKWQELLGPFTADPADIIATG